MRKTRKKEWFNLKKIKILIVSIVVLILLIGIIWYALKNGEQNGSRNSENNVEVVNEKPEDTRGEIYISSINSAANL